MYKAVSTPYHVIQRDISHKLLTAAYKRGDSVLFDNEGTEFHSQWLGLISQLSMAGVRVVFTNTDGICDIVKATYPNVKEQDHTVTFDPAG